MPPIENASTHPLPALAFSVRQPWTWAIVHAGKPVENRDWKPGNPGLRFRGRVCLHASAGMTKAEYRDARDFIESLGIKVPAFEDLQRGGIIGVTTIVDVVKRHDSRWFFGPVGLVLKDTQPVAFIPVKGALGFFEWRQRVMEPAAPTSPPPSQGSLL
ncbi:hypothetical protein [Rhizobium sp. GN54]|uniref:hypothetical protein n=1 Tax=Rhizobium sp. GN54 TaxID=2898150 RepID=UPI001E5544EE|nr:hypothetical protein [Rhizobium sp. GN54]MCD2181609.1 hypothetical protein [Rhizobium sp. GN54]